jgi:hypothetical protein
VRSSNTLELFQVILAWSMRRETGGGGLILMEARPILHSNHETAPTQNGWKHDRLSSSNHHFVDAQKPGHSFISVYPLGL